jgi:hypothetical protein
VKNHSVYGTKVGGHRTLFSSTKWSEMAAVLFNLRSFCVGDPGNLLVHMYMAERMVRLGKVMEWVLGSSWVR